MTTIIPKQLNITLKTSIPGYEIMRYRGAMTIPDATDPVQFNPMLPLQASVISEIPQRYRARRFLNKRLFIELLKACISAGAKAAANLEAATEGGIVDDNIRMTLSYLFPSNSTITIGGNEYTIDGFNWNSGNWQIEADPIVLNMLPPSVVTGGNYSPISSLVGGPAGVGPVGVGLGTTGPVYTGTGPAGFLYSALSGMFPAILPPPPPPPPAPSVPGVPTLVAPSATPVSLSTDTVQTIAHMALDDAQKAAQDKKNAELAQVADGAYKQFLLKSPTSNITINPSALAYAQKKLNLTPSQLQLLRKNIQQQQVVKLQNLPDTELVKQLVYALFKQIFYGIIRSHANEEVTDENVKEALFEENSKLSDLLENVVAKDDSDIANYRASQGANQSATFTMQDVEFIANKALNNNNELSIDPQVKEAVFHVLTNNAIKEADLIQAAKTIITSDSGINPNAITFLQAQEVIAKKIFLFGLLLTKQNGATIMTYPYFVRTIQSDPFLHEVLYNIISISKDEVYEIADNVQAKHNDKLYANSQRVGSNFFIEGPVRDIVYTLVTNADAEQLMKTYYKFSETPNAQFKEIQKFFANCLLLDGVNTPEQEDSLTFLSFVYMLQDGFVYSELFLFLTGLTVDEVIVIAMNVATNIKENDNSIGVFFTPTALETAFNTMYQINPFLLEKDAKKEANEDYENKKGYIKAQAIYLRKLLVEAAALKVNPAAAENSVPNVEINADDIIAALKQNKELSKGLHLEEASDFISQEETQTQTQTQQLQEQDVQRLQSVRERLINYFSQSRPLIMMLLQEPLTDDRKDIAEYMELTTGQYELLDSINKLYQQVTVGELDGHPTPFYSFLESVATMLQSCSPAAGQQITANELLAAIIQQVDASNTLQSQLLKMANHNAMISNNSYQKYVLDLNSQSADFLSTVQKAKQAFIDSAASDSFLVKLKENTDQTAFMEPFQPIPQQELTSYLQNNLVKYVDINKWNVISYTFVSRVLSEIYKVRIIGIEEVEDGQMRMIADNGGKQQNNFDNSTIILSTIILYRDSKTGIYLPVNFSYFYNPDISDPVVCFAGNATSFQYDKINLIPPFYILLYIYYQLYVPSLYSPYFFYNELMTKIHNIVNLYAGSPEYTKALTDLFGAQYVAQLPSIKTVADAENIIPQVFDSLSLGQGLGSSEGAIPLAMPTSSVVRTNSESERIFDLLKSKIPSVNALFRDYQSEPTKLPVADVDNNIAELSAQEAKQETKDAYVAFNSSIRSTAFSNVVYSLINKSLGSFKKWVNKGVSSYIGEPVQQIGAGEYSKLCQSLLVHGDKKVEPHNRFFNAIANSLNLHNENPYVDKIMWKYTDNTKTITYGEEVRQFSFQSIRLLVWYYFQESFRTDRIAIAEANANKLNQIFQQRKQTNPAVKPITVYMENVNLLVGIKKNKSDSLNPFAPILNADDVMTYMTTGNLNDHIYFATHYGGTEIDYIAIRNVLGVLPIPLTVDKDNKIMISAWFWSVYNYKSVDTPYKVLFLCVRPDQTHPHVNLYYPVSFEQGKQEVVAFDNITSTSAATEENAKYYPPLYILVLIYGFYVNLTWNKIIMQNFKDDFFLFSYPTQVLLAIAQSNTDIMKNSNAVFFSKINPEDFAQAGYALKVTKDNTREEANAFKNISQMSRNVANREMAQLSKFMQSSTDGHDECFQNVFQKQLPSMEDALIVEINKGETFMLHGDNWVSKGRQTVNQPLTKSYSKGANIRVYTIQQTIEKDPLSDRPLPDNFAESFFESVAISINFYNKGNNAPITYPCIKFKYTYGDKDKPFSSRAIRYILYEQFTAISHVWQSFAQDQANMLNNKNAYVGPLPPLIERRNKTLVPISPDKALSYFLNTYSIESNGIDCLFKCLGLVIIPIECKYKTGNVAAANAQIVDMPNATFPFVIPAQPNMTAMFMSKESVESYSPIVINESIIFNPETFVVPFPLLFLIFGYDMKMRNNMQTKRSDIRNMFLPKLQVLNSAYKKLQKQTTQFKDKFNSYFGIDIVNQRGGLTTEEWKSEITRNLQQLRRQWHDIEKEKQKLKKVTQKRPYNIRQGEIVNEIEKNEKLLKDILLEKEQEKYRNEQTAALRFYENNPNKNQQSRALELEQLNKQFLYFLAHYPHSREQDKQYQEFIWTMQREKMKQQAIAEWESYLPQMDNHQQQFVQFLKQHPFKGSQQLMEDQVREFNFTLSQQRKIIQNFLNNDYVPTYDPMVDYQGMNELLNGLRREYNNALVEFEVRAIEGYDSEADERSEREALESEQAHYAETANWWNQQSLQNPYQPQNEANFNMQNSLRNAQQARQRRENWQNEAYKQQFMRQQAQLQQQGDKWEDDIAENQKALQQQDKYQRLAQLQHSLQNYGLYPTNQSSYPTNQSSYPMSIDGQHQIDGPQQINGLQQIDGPQQIDGQTRVGSPYPMSIEGKINEGNSPTTAPSSKTNVPVPVYHTMSLRQTLKNNPVQGPAAPGAARPGSAVPGSAVSGSAVSGLAVPGAAPKGILKSASSYIARPATPYNRVNTPPPPGAAPAGVPAPAEPLPAMPSLTSAAYAINIELQLRGVGGPQSSSEDASNARCKEISDAMWRSLSDLTGMPQLMPPAKVPAAKTAKKVRGGRNVHKKCEYKTRRKHSHSSGKKRGTRKHVKVLPPRIPRKTRRRQAE